MSDDGKCSGKKAGGEVKVGSVILQRVVREGL